MRRITDMSGFLHVTLFIACAIFLLVACVHYIGKRIPTGDLQITDHVADRHETAGIDNSDIRSAGLEDNRAYDSYETRDLEAEARARALDERARALRQSRYVPDVPAVSDTTRAPVSMDSAETGGSAQVAVFAPPDESVPANVSPHEPVSADNGTGSAPQKTFTSKTNARISFRHPADVSVTEKKASDDPDDTTVIFTIRQPDGRTISMTYDKVRSGCFDYVRAFAIDPKSAIIDYRIISPEQSLFLESKYKARRTDEEIGSYAKAGSDPTRPFVYVANVCAQTAVPTRIRLSSVQFKAGEKAVLSGIYDSILSSLTL